MAAQIVILVAFLAFVGWVVVTTVKPGGRRRRRLLAEPFPPEWQRVLDEHVAFHALLDDAEKDRFRREVQLFIGEKRITGVKTDVDDTTRVLVACSAVIPIFGFPEWEWTRVHEILIYPTRFSQSFQMGAGNAHRTLGMVGSGPMSGIVILSKPDLLDGFRRERDRRNVGIHEFAHLFDKADGAIDGVPGAGLGREAIQTWVSLMHREMNRMRRGQSDIDPYGLTNEAEFFAVISEYFFERPKHLQREHPELYAALSAIFRQDLRTRVTALVRRGSSRR